LKSNPGEMQYGFFSQFLLERLGVSILRKYFPRYYFFCLSIFSIRQPIWIDLKALKQPLEKLSGRFHKEKYLAQLENLK